LTRLPGARRKNRPSRPTTRYHGSPADSAAHRRAFSTPGAMPHSPSFDDSCLTSCIVGQALDGMCVGLVVTNSAGRITWMNRSAQSHLGIDEAEAKGELLSKALRDPGMGEFWHRACGEDEVAFGEVELHWPRPCQLKANASKCFGPSGQDLGRVLLFCDVTSEHSLQLELSQQATARLLEMAEGWHGERGVQAEAGLTPQELRVVRLVGRGSSNDEIARELHVAVSTVRTHLKHCYAKLNLTTRSEVIALAVRTGLS